MESYETMEYTLAKPWFLQLLRQWSCWAAPSATRGNPTSSRRYNIHIRWMHKGGILSEKTSFLSHRSQKLFKNHCSFNLKVRNVKVWVCLQRLKMTNSLQSFYTSVHALSSSHRHKLLLSFTSNTFSTFPNTDKTTQHSSSLKGISLLLSFPHTRTHTHTDTSPPLSSQLTLTTRNNEANKC